MKKNKYDDLQQDIRDWQAPDIEAFDNIYPDRDYTIVMTTNEFSCVCPKTGLPDFATLKLEYIPDQKCIELKSFKEYLLAFRDKGIFHENVVNRIIDDLVVAVGPRKLKLEGIFNNRGGIQTTVFREYLK